MFILPFEFNPILKNYQLKAFELGIIEGNEKNIKPWVFNRYINQLYMIKDKRVTYTNYDRWHALEGITSCQKLCVKSVMLNENTGINIHHLIRQMIQTGHYVFGRYNEYFIPGKNAYNKYYYVHDFIIYGYDEKKQIYYSAGYLSDGKYQPFSITFDDFNKSLLSVTTEKLNFHFIKYIGGIDNEINIRMIYDDLFDYLHSINRRNIVNNNKTFGIECEKIMIDYYQQLYNQKTTHKIDLRQPKFFEEMKALMFERLRYLEEHLYIDTSISKKYDTIKNDAKIISMLALKYNSEANKDILLRIISRTSESINKEQEILSLVLNQLKSWVG